MPHPFFFKTKLSLSVGVLCLFCVGALVFYSGKLRQEQEDLQQQLAHLHGLAVRSQKALALLQTHKATLTAFEACHFDHPATLEKLRAALPAGIEPQIDLKAASPLKDPSTSGELVAQEISFCLSCLHERDIGVLLHHLLTQGPGLFQIHEVTISRLSPLSEEILAKIAAGDPQALLEGRVIATWIHR